jgi:hypothetical protein
MGTTRLGREGMGKLWALEEGAISSVYTGFDSLGVQ